MHLNDDAIVRSCRGVPTTAALKQHPGGEVLALCCGEGVSEVVHYMPQGKDIAKKPPTQALAEELEEVDKGRFGLSEVCYIQFLCVRMSHIQGVISVAPQIPLLISAGARHRLVIAKGLEDGDVAQSVPSGNKVYINYLPPSKPKPYKAIKHKSVDERPRESVLTTSKPNKNLQH